MTWKVGDTLFEVLHPPGEGMPPRGKTPASLTNNRSAVVRVSMGGVSFLLPGDVEAEQEAWLAARGGLRSTVLLAPHHGSRTSSTEPFLRAVAPQYAVFSSRADPQGAAPAEVAERYRALGIRSFHTGTDGMVSFSTDGKRLSLETYLSRHSETADLHQGRPSR
jgi:competence protein ComEC